MLFDISNVPQKIALGTGRNHANQRILRLSLYYPGDVAIFWDTPYDEVQNMDRELATKFNRGDPFDIPENPDMFELYVGWFFGRIRAIVAVENHIYKWRGVDNVLDLLEEASQTVGVNVVFFYSEGQWYIDGFETEEDFLNLPLVAKAFSKLYRYQRGQKNNPKEEIIDGRRVREIR